VVSVRLDAKAVGIVVVLVAGAVDVFLNATRREAWASKRRPEGGMQLFELRRNRPAPPWHQAHRPARIEPREQVAQDHFEHGEEDAELDGGGLHSRRAGNGHRAGGEVEFLDARVEDDLAAALHVLHRMSSGCVVDKIDARARVHACHAVPMTNDVSRPR